MGDYGEGSEAAKLPGRVWQIGALGFGVYSSGFVH